MKKTDWIDVIGKIDPAYVKEAEQWSKAAQKKRNLKHFTAMAACVCILLAGAVRVSFDLWVQNKDTGAETESAVAEGMNEGASAPNEGNETAVAKAEEEQTESVESESFADTDEQITINEVSELTTIAIDVGNGQEERMSAEELEQYYGVTVFPKNLPENLVAYAEEHDTDTAYVQSSIQPLDGEKEKNQTTADFSLFPRPMAVYCFVHRLYLYHAPLHMPQDFPADFWEKLSLHNTAPTPLHSYALPVHSPHRSQSLSVH